ncbi:hypothetical protein PM10SUCC1_14910 [Propionigenium maris DSM 9537]|uniref:LTXXQ motif family protein n=1 Tax=Propionigenium maris DSM 9537 TaxID=1123000 RepID=A0A9W6GLX1_9FUSO|nr:hypothetical protein [Propionigenium maris]GLI55977.1 hypothetical protein PM10SUCC1_14910 [Propionigenium maris DSM 9537]
MKKIIGILMVVLTTSIFAQETQPKAEQATAVVERVSVKVSNSRQLTAEEQREFHSIVKAFEEKQTLAQLEVKEINLKIHREMLGEDPNLKTINKLIDKKAKIVAQMEKDLFEVNFKIHNLL